MGYLKAVYGFYEVVALKFVSNGTNHAGLTFVNWVISD